MDVRNRKLNRVGNADCVDTQGVYEEELSLKMKRAYLDDQDTDEWQRNSKKMKRETVSCADNESKYEEILNEKMSRVSLDDQVSDGVKRKILRVKRWFTDDGSMGELPDDLVFEMLTWLPVKDLHRCKRVSKHWCSIISSQPFMEAYKNRQRCELLVS